jgi:hypothetical protein
MRSQKQVIGNKHNSLKQNPRKTRSSNNRKEGDGEGKKKMKKRNLGGRGKCEITDTKVYVIRGMVFGPMVLHSVVLASVAIYTIAIAITI